MILMDNTLHFDSIHFSANSLESWVPESIIEQYFFLIYTSSLKIYRYHVLSYYLFKCLNFLTWLILMFWDNWLMKHLYKCFIIQTWWTEMLDFLPRANPMKKWLYKERDVIFLSWHFWNNWIWTQSSRWTIYFYWSLK